MERTIKELYSQCQIKKEVIDYCEAIEATLQEKFAEIDQIAEYNQIKVLKAMQENQLSEIHFAATTGYGYDDLGRDVLEKIYATIFGTEAALVRPQIMSGTHALAIALYGNLRPGDVLFSPVGKPYDTLDDVIGIRQASGSLKEYGISYVQADLLADGSFNREQIKKIAEQKPRLATIQRSRGYADRPTLSVEQIAELIGWIKSISPETICMVDNCYGEFVQKIEPTQVGADLCVGSLIKNPGGGLAPTGGYIVGKQEFVENAANRFSAPGLGKEIGATLGLNQSIFQGLFLAPEVVAAALKGAVFLASVYESIGFAVFPTAKQQRYDIIQAIQLETAERMCAFCEGIQAAAPVDSHVVPVPAAMPGYEHPVIMAAGSFVQGASIELSADAPMKEPYRVFFQGGLTWHHAKFAVFLSLQKLYEKGLVAFKK